MMTMMAMAMAMMLQQQWQQQVVVRWSWGESHWKEEAMWQNCYSNYYYYYCCCCYCLSYFHYFDFDSFLLTVCQ
jgi:hypothetical protein